MELTPELHAKFLKFRESYEQALTWLADAPGHAEQKQQSALNTAARAINASEIEVELFRRFMTSEIPKPE
jgi:hypothetical protein